MLPSIYPRALHSSTIYPSGAQHLLFGMKFGGLAADPVAYANYLHIIYAPPFPETSTTIGLMSSSRGGHTATLIPDGRVLITGGDNGATTHRTTDIYDPGTNLWSPTGSMSVSRTRHTANLLPVGNVLATGGYSQHPSTGATRTAEVYYVNSGQWTPTTSMLSAREAHASVYITTGAYAGNIMVIGGYKDGTYLKECEIYNPLTEVWLSSATTTAIASMNTKRSKHTAVTLKNGKVFVFGGINETGSLYSAEVYDPLTNVWKTVSSPATTNRRYSHRATLLLDGTILITGGTNEAGPMNTGVIFNPDTGAYVLGTDIKVGGWSYTTNNLSFSSDGRFGHSATLLPNGNVLIVGGSSNNVPAISYPELYEASLSSFSYTMERVEARGLGHTATLLPSGDVLFTGGLLENGTYSNDGTTMLFSQLADSLDQPSLRHARGLQVSQAIYDRGSNLTLTSGTTNYFFGQTEASGGGYSNSGHYHPRIHAMMMDNLSGFNIDLSTSVYSIHAGSALNSWYTAPWQLKLPPLSMLPYGWYHMRSASNGVFSNQSAAILVSIPAPTGVISGLQSVAASLSTTTIKWTWQRNTIKRKNVDTLNAGESASERYMVLSSTNNVFLTYLDIPAATDTAEWTQSNLLPNSKMAIRVAGINISTTTQFVDSATTYTYANVPHNLAISSASFNSVNLAWSANGNSSSTPYEVTYCMSGCNNEGASWSTAVDFEQNNSSTGARIASLSSRKTYYFRVRARNGAGVVPTTTDRIYGVYNGYCCKYCLPAYERTGQCVNGVDNSAYDQYKSWVSTATVSYPENLAGNSTGYNSITWTWSKPA
ncbi:MAG TPA: kelch repeat-containing protein, partial [Elusimicrobiales bacterium]|nr:kelch repeat-containing protein [Elusimicrobiales bacterium]